MTILRDIYAPQYESKFLLRTDRANLYTISDVEPTWARRGMIWSDISVNPPVLRVLTNDGWVDWVASLRDIQHMGGGNTVGITATSDTAINTITYDFTTAHSIFGFVQYNSTGTGYGRVGLTLGGLSVNTAATDGGCIARDDVTNRGGFAYFWIPRRDTGYAGVGDFGYCWSARSGSSAIVKIGLTADMVDSTWSSIVLTGACSAASTTMYARWTVMAW